MTKPLFIAGLAAVAFGGALATPAAAQGSALIIYGNDSCPSNTVCVRAPESERYRIPESLRSGPLPSSQAPNRAAAASSVGAVNTGPASCSNIGGGGGSTCLSNDIKAYRAEKRANAAAAAASPEPR